MAVGAIWREIDGSIEFPSPRRQTQQELRQLIAIKGPFPIAKAGEYKLQAFADGVAQEPPFRFWIEQMEQPGQARPNRQTRRHSRQQ